MNVQFINDLFKTHFFSGTSNYSHTGEPDESDFEAQRLNKMVLDTVTQARVDFDDIIKKHTKRGQS